MHCSHTPRCVEQASTQYRTDHAGSDDSFRKAGGIFRSDGSSARRRANGAAVDGGDVRHRCTARILLGVWNRPRHSTALITQAVTTLSGKQVGYSGLMVPVLEDARMAQRWTEGTYGIDALLAYSSVCGTGLDTVPH